MGSGYRNKKSAAINGSVDSRAVTKVVSGDASQGAPLTTDIVTSKPGVSIKRMCDLHPVFDFIVSYKISHDGNSPSIREIMFNFGINSTSMVRAWLIRMQRLGWIHCDYEAPRSIVVTGGQWRLVADGSRK